VDPAEAVEAAEAVVADSVVAVEEDSAAAAVVAEDMAAVAIAVEVDSAAAVEEDAAVAVDAITATRRAILPANAPRVANREVEEDNKEDVIEIDRFLGLSKNRFKILHFE
jgi:hypothetical protein